MRAELANPNHCAVPLLNRADVNMSWYDSTYLYIISTKGGKWYKVYIPEYLLIDRYRLKAALIRMYLKFS